MTTNFSPALSPKFIGFDLNGKVLSGGKVYAYSAGTMVPKDTYTDYTGNTANPWPVVLDASGQGDIWILDNAEAYKFVLHDSLDNFIWEEDGIFALKGATGTDGGPPGPPGLQGIPGIQGIQGPRGNSGDQGPQGAAATKGSGIVTFKTAGAFSWTVPTGAYQLLITACGGGGGGCSGSAASASTSGPVGGNSGGGGGHGSFVQYQAFNCSPGDTINVVIGAGGASDLPGGTTTVGLNGSQIISVPGGAQGKGALNGTNPLGAWNGVLGSLLILYNNQVATEPQHICSVGGQGGGGATGPWGQGGLGGEMGIAPDVPVGSYYKPAFNGQPGGTARGNGSGGGGGGGGATYFYGSGNPSSAPVTSFSEPQGQVALIGCQPMAGTGGLGGSGAPGIVIIHYLVQ